jgi:hypothetical protein
MLSHGAIESRTIDTTSNVPALNGKAEFDWKRERRPEVRREGQAKGRGAAEMGEGGGDILQRMRRESSGNDY